MIAQYDKSKLEKKDEGPDVGALEIVDMDGADLQVSVHDTKDGTTVRLRKIDDAADKWIVEDG